MSQKKQSKQESKTQPKTPKSSSLAEKKTATQEESENSKRLKRAANDASLNRSLGISAQDWKDVQSRIGTSVDGVPGVSTAIAIRSWRKRHNLGDSGVLESHAHAKILCAPRAQNIDISGIELGCWLDVAHALKKDQQRRKLDLLRSRGIEHLALMVLDAHGEPKWTPSRYGAIVKHIRDMGFTLSIGGYFLPDAEKLPSQLSYIKELCQQGLPDAFEGDQEHQHKAGRVKGFGSLLGASAAIVDGLLEVGDSLKFEPEIRITTHPDHPEWRLPTIVSLEDVDHRVNQAYAEATRNGKAVPYSDRKYGPGGSQRFSLDQVAMWEETPFYLGLCAYDKAWAGRSADEVLREEFGACAQRGVKRAFLWSEKWIDDRSESPITTFLRRNFGA